MTKSHPKPLPTHSGWPLLGNVVPFLRDLFYYPQALKDQYGPVFQMSIPTYDPVFIFDPEAIARVLEKNHQNYRKSRDYDTLKITLGQGLLTNEGESWKRVRKELQPYFFENVVTQFMEIMFRHSRQLVADWKKNSEAVHLNPLMKSLTLQIGSEAFFGQDLSSLNINVPAVVDELNALGIKKMRFPRNLIPYSLPTPLHRRLRKLIRTLDTEIYRLQNQAQDDSTNLLTLLVNNPNLSVQQVRDELVTFLIAGYETTANSLMFTLALLTNHPAIQQNVIAEVRKTALTPENYKQWPTQFPLLYASIKESLRLYPPAWMIGRAAIEDDVLAGYHLPAGKNVIIDLFLLHRQKEIFPDPDAFKPQRFLESSPPKHHYLPFGGGPRVCIGQHFSMLEMVTVLHHIFSEFRLESVTSEIKLAPLVTLTPQAGIFVRPGK